MLILRSQGHLLFSEWTIRQRTLSGSGSARYHACLCVLRGSPWNTFRERDGKSRSSDHPCNVRGKIFPESPPSSFTCQSPQDHLLKERFP